MGLAALALAGPRVACRRDRLASRALDKLGAHLALEFSLPFLSPPPPSSSPATEHNHDDRITTTNT
jgi:hypothetical protein